MSGRLPIEISNHDIDNEAYVLACDYINARLRKRGINWSTCPQLPDPSRLHLAMRSWGDEFERKYKQHFDDMCSDLHLTPCTAYPTFFGVADELFKDGIAWGRIVALFSFGGTLSEYCIRKELPQLVTYVADWVGLYVETRLSQWIVENGGWEGFLNFYERQPKTEQWSRLKQVITGIGAVCGALGVVTLGAMLASKG